jgi:hypothetical protein
VPGGPPLRSSAVPECRGRGVRNVLLVRRSSNQPAPPLQLRVEVSSAGLQKVALSHDASQVRSGSGAADAAAGLPRPLIVGSRRAGPSPARRCCCPPAPQVLPKLLVRPVAPVSYYEVRPKASALAKRLMRAAQGAARPARTPMPTPPAACLPARCASPSTSSASSRAPTA